MPPTAGRPGTASAVVGIAPSDVHDVASQPATVPSDGGGVSDHPAGPLTATNLALSAADLTALEHLDREALLAFARQMVTGGVTASFYGKHAAMHLVRRVRPRVTRRVPALCVGSAEDQSRNLLLEGENLQAMVTLHKHRGDVDLIVTDPPYNTGRQFRYSDMWERDPNDPDLGPLVAKDDGSRHTKWMRAMLPRLQTMEAMLKEKGVIAICIDENELFNLGMLMDEVFGAENRLAIINWQKAHAPKNDASHVATTTEYVLVYAKTKALARTGLLPRDAHMDRGFRNPDHDPDGNWSGKDPTARQHRTKTAYAIQSPFTGHLHYPNGEFAFSGPLPEARAHWIGVTRKQMLTLLEEWGSKYVARDLGDGRGPALVLADSSVTLDGYDPSADSAVSSAHARAKARMAQPAWPRLYFREDVQKRPGFGRPRWKTYAGEVQQGKVATTFWANEDYDTPFAMSTQSWNHEQSGHSDGAKKELDAIVGPGHGFDTVKPLRLIMKIIQIWCPPGGIVLDPYAGSGTTGHAVLELNHRTGANRRFILIEQGQPEGGDKYARTLTWDRLQRVIAGDWVSAPVAPAADVPREAHGASSAAQADGQRIPAKARLVASSRRKRVASADASMNGDGSAPAALGGGFEFRALTRQIDAKTLLSMRRDELVDVVIATHWESGRRAGPSLLRIDDPKRQYLVGKNDRNEGYFVIWNGEGPVGELDMETYADVVQDAKAAGLASKYHVYARSASYRPRSVEFYKIPDRILAHLGLRDTTDPFHVDGEEDADEAEAS